MTDRYHFDTFELRRISHTDALEDWTITFATTERPWVVYGVAKLTDNRLWIEQLSVCIDVRVVPPDGTPSRKTLRDHLPRNGVTADALRSIKMGVLQDSIRREMIESDDVAQRFPVAKLGLSAAQRAATTRRLRQALDGTKPNKGRPKGSTKGQTRMTEPFLRDFAMESIRLSKNDGSVNAALADKFTVSRERIRDYLRAAREAGWLAPTSQGKRGVMPGPRLTEWMKQPWELER